MGKGRKQGNDKEGDCWLVRFFCCIFVYKNRVVQSESEPGLRIGKGGQK